MEDQLAQKIKQMEALMAEIKVMQEQPAAAGEKVSTPSASIQQTPQVAETQKSSAVVEKTPEKMPEKSSQPSESNSTSPEKSAISTEEKESAVPEGEVGVFDGEFVHMGNEKKYQVPPNYASKSTLVKGDKLQLVEHGDQNKFKIVEQVDRIEVSGILTKKENQWIILCDEGEFRVIAASIRFYEGEIGDTVTILLPKDFKTSKPEWGAVKSIQHVNPPKPRDDEDGDVPPRRQQYSTQPQQQGRSENRIPSRDENNALPQPMQQRAPEPTLKPPATVAPSKPAAPIIPPVAPQPLQPEEQKPLVIEPVEGSKEVEIAPVDSTDIPDLR